ncbi:PIG-L deacetylase family protein [Occallatibacter savannae]|uniref:PIG-L deacetylase family protein n=1 Tax=Occallatibacter savannae TaxID=1002691 RepID=UPI0013A595C3|nr:PIG-L family deacetylase [Occallatibacter savannae]
MAAQEELSASELHVGPAQSTIAAEDLLRRGTAPAGSEMVMPCAMVVVAHADDETIALGARMERLDGAHFVHVTDGAPRNEEDSRAHGFKSLDDYREARAAELARMFQEAGLQRASSVGLHFRDQEAGLHLTEITRQIAEQVALREPEIIFTHPYEGGHPDHDACAFAVHHAVEMNRARGGRRPLVLEAPFYHAGRTGFEAGRFLRLDGWMPEIAYELSEEERAQKRKLMACFVSQRETLKGFDDAWERFRIAPVYDFTHPPHSGKLLYENYPWGMTSERFCQLAEEAEGELENDAARAL